jgi:alpha-1,2-mannosyltransferase
MATPGDGGRRLARLAGSRRLLFASVAVLAFLIRLTPLLIGGGLGSYGRYDDGVYYAASDALTFGRVPYRDFVLLHPPGILLVLAPFALLGRLTSDPTGMAAGRLAFMGIGALNAVLVTALAHRWGPKAALTAGVLYACWLPAVYGEQSTLLEPLGGTALLVALLLLLKTARPPTIRAEVLAGVALGLAVSMKIWYVAPWGVVVLWLLVAGRARAAVRVAVSGTVALLIVLLPFMILARGRMFDMVVRDQLLRPQADRSRGGRLANILGIHIFLAGHHTELAIATEAALVVLAVAAVVCWVDRTARVIVALLVVNLLVLLLSPSYFAHYAALTAAPGALVLGVALGKLAAARRLRPASTALVVVSLVAFLASGVWVASRPEGTSFPGAQLAKAAPAGCVTADDPQALIQMNRLSRDLRSGCRVDIDVTGITYDTLRRVRRDGKPVPRRNNRAFQQYLYNYLVSGNSFVVARRKGDGLTPDTSGALARRPALARSHGLVLQRGKGGH